MTGFWASNRWYVDGEWRANIYIKKNRYRIQLWHAYTGSKHATSYDCLETAKAVAMALVAMR